jgi:PAS domain-containing protein
MDLSALRAAEARFALLVEHTDQVVVALGPDGRVASWNRAAEKRFGRSRSQAVGRAIGDLLPPDLARALESRHQSHRAGRPPEPLDEPGWSWELLASEDPEGELLCLARPLPGEAEATPVWSRALELRLDEAPGPVQRHG